MSWRRPAARLALALAGLAVAEGSLRALLVGTAVTERLAFRMGPDATELAWWVDRVRGRGVEAPQRRYDPRTGWVNAPGAFQSTGVVETTDDAGHRRTGPRGDGPRVLLVGDSFTYGTDAADDHTWAWRLQASHPDWAVTNAGVPGFGLGQAWLALRAEPRADVVVVGLNSLMVTRTTERFGVYARPVVEAERSGCTPPAPVPPPEAWLARITWRPKLYDALRVATWPLRAPPSDLAWARSEALLDCISGDAGAPVVVVWLPGHVAVEAASDPPDHARFTAWCAGHAGACVDATPAMRRRHAEGAQLRRETHWSAEGHEVVAGVVDAAIAQVLEARP